MLAIIIFIVGRILARWITNMAVSAMKFRNLDPQLCGFFQSLIYWGLFSLVLVAVLAQLGIQTASLIAALGAAGLAIGLALQGSLSNFAAGVLIIILRPFKVGDFVDIAGESGRVKHVKMFTTDLITADNKCVIIPNARVLDSNIVNHSSTGSRRIDMVFGVAYTDDIDFVRSVIKQVIEEEPRIRHDLGETTIAVIELADSSVNLAVRPWVKSEDYWDVYMDLNEAIKKRFDENGISIPFPQREVRTFHVNTKVNKQASTEPANQ